MNKCINQLNPQEQGFCGAIRYVLIHHFSYNDSFHKKIIFYIYFSPPSLSILVTFLLPVILLFHISGVAPPIV